MKNTGSLNIGLVPMNSFRQVIIEVIVRSISSCENKKYKLQGLTILTSKFCINYKNSIRAVNFSFLGIYTF
jgi:hypothetical protein